ncbi:biotin-dependent carboxyltransferase [Marinobacter sediminum]|uniref:5-oxoprolinase subunit C family protein n=1 Tax=Marinobacter sediminum TaxID=256323 RepID=UPI00202EB91F|nr:biotin-dependent carboxyltransferase family protein [Marinobacter sediminum]MCM0612901.1 biotin-dependent carboxyltransferase [Marinobacter sediminum]
MSFEVLDPGMLALIQDTGRYGYQHIGVTTGGPMDEHAFLWANRLLNNELHAPQVEITFGKLRLLAHEDACIAITGADLGARINDQPVLPWQTYQISRGDRIEFTMPVSGLRAYLAVSGGFKATLKLGSCATVSREGLGGLDGDGAKLTKGDRLEFDAYEGSIVATVPDSELPDYRQPLRLGVIPGYQYRHFSAFERMKFFSCDYEVSQNIDRMGYRLSGDAIQSELNGIVSEGIAYGAIQVPSDGQPIVLMKDRQTIGGYPKIGCLSALDAGQLAQRGPGASVSFYLSDVADSEASRMLFNRRLQKGAAGISRD